jgi:hypothetical protein
VRSFETSVTTKNPEVEAVCSSETSVTTKNPEVEAVSSFEAMVLSMKTVMFLRKVTPQNNAVAQLGRFNPNSRKYRR